MRQITLGGTGITVPQNAFGALPIQRVGTEEAVRILRAAYDGGMRFFDTARAYTDSEEKLGAAFGDMPDEAVHVSSKTMSRDPERIREELDTTLSNLRRDYLDLYQLHCVDRCYRPGDGTGVYEALLEAKESGRVRHIGVTAHKIGVAEECVDSGLYETMQFPFSYLSGEREVALVERCREAGMGFIAMKGLAGGLIRRSDAAMAFIRQFDNVLPIWGIQRASELEEWLSFFDEAPDMTPELEAFVESERRELAGDFCRGCGYCMPCPQGIVINSCARMSLMIRRAPSESWLSEEWQREMAKIETCVECRQCASRCPYELDTPALLRRNLEDYRKVLAGEVSVD